MTEPMIESLIGDYQDFFGDQVSRLAGQGIDVTTYPVSHIAVRLATFEEYIELRDRLEAVSCANVENMWSGRPISKLMLREPQRLGANHDLELIELIPPVHRSGYPMGLEHVGFVVGEGFDDFKDCYREVLSGQQDQGPVNQPLFITFDNGRSVKFHRHSLHNVVEMEGRSFDGFWHVDG